VGNLGIPSQNELYIGGPSLVSRVQFPASDPILGKFIAQVEAFQAAIANNAEPNASGQDGLEVVRITEAILRSSREGKAVKIER